MALWRSNIPGRSHYSIRHVNQIATTSSGSSGGAPTNILTATSLAFAAVNSAVGAVTAGWTVLLLSGSADWGTSTLTIPSGIYLKGSGRDNTLIRRTGDAGSNGLIEFDGTGSLTCELSDMQLQGNHVNTIDDYGVRMTNGCIDFKIHDMHIEGFSFTNIHVGYTQRQRGVVYSCSLMNAYAIDRFNLGYGIQVEGESDYPTLSLGGQNSVFVEDCYMYGNRHNISSNAGSRYVFRYNTVYVTEPAKDYAMTDAHGLSNMPTGSRQYEIYNNTYLGSLSANNCHTAIGIRGGDGVIFNNYISSSYKTFLWLEIEGFSCGTYPGTNQIRSCYIWNNTGVGSMSVVCSASVQLNRDYFLTSMPAYSPYTYPHPLRT